MADNWQWYRKWDGVVVRVEWLPKSPINRASNCDRCKRRVLKGERRLRVDDGKGPVRKRGRKKNNTYLCTDCARNVPDQTRDQQTMF